MAEIIRIKPAKTDGSIAPLCSISKPSSELCRTKVAALKVKIERQAVRIAKRTRTYACALPVLIIIMVLGSVVCRAQSVSVDDARCKALATTDFSSIPDAPTHVSEAVLAKDVQGLTGKAQVSEDLAKAIGQVQPTCRVSGYVAPNSGFVILLPVSHWNGKLLHVGCGGWCGSTGYVAGSCAKHAGYACVGTDMGHTGGGGLWSRNNLQGQTDFEYRATHVVTLAAKAILQRFYATTRQQVLFCGMFHRRLSGHDRSAALSLGL